MIQTASSSVRTDTNILSLSADWNERSSLGALPKTNFIYEVTFLFGSNVTELPGIKCKECYNKYHKLSHMVVSEIHDKALSTVVLPGDIILKVNDKSLVKTGNVRMTTDLFKEEISLCTTPRTVRFLRCATSPPSPIELKLYTSTDKISARLRLQSSSDGQTTSLNTVYMDPQCPTFIKKLLQGQRVVWDTNYNTQISYSIFTPPESITNAPPTLTSTATTAITSGNNSKNMKMYPLKEGIFRDMKNRWVVFVQLPIYDRHQAKKPMIKSISPDVKTVIESSMVGNKRKADDVNKITTTSETKDTSKLSKTSDAPVSDEKIDMGTKVTDKSIESSTNTTSLNTGEPMKYIPLCIGKFQNEGDALKAYTKAQQEIEITGKYMMKRTIQYPWDFTPVPIPTPAAPTPVSVPTVSAGSSKSNTSSSLPPTSYYSQNTSGNMFNMNTIPTSNSTNPSGSASASTSMNVNLPTSSTMSYGSYAASKQQQQQQLQLQQQHQQQQQQQNTQSQNPSLTGAMMAQNVANYARAYMANASVGLHSGGISSGMTPAGPMNTLSMNQHPNTQPMSTGSTTTTNTSTNRNSGGGGGGGSNYMQTMQPNTLQAGYAMPYNVATMNTLQNATTNRLTNAMQTGTNNNYNFQTMKGPMTGSGTYVNPALANMNNAPTGTVNTNVSAGNTNAMYTNPYNNMNYAMNTAAAAANMGMNNIYSNQMAAAAMMNPNMNMMNNMYSNNMGNTGYTQNPNMNMGTMGASMGHYPMQGQGSSGGTNNMNMQMYGTPMNMSNQTAMSQMNTGMMNNMSTGYMQGNTGNTPNNNTQGSTNTTTTLPNNPSSGNG